MPLLNGVRWKLLTSSISLARSGESGAGGGGGRIASADGTISGRRAPPEQRPPAHRTVRGSHRCHGDSPRSLWPTRIAADRAAAPAPESSVPTDRNRG